MALLLTHRYLKAQPPPTLPLLLTVIWLFIEHVTQHSRVHSRTDHQKNHHHQPSHQPSSPHRQQQQGICPALCVHQSSSIMWLVVVLFPNSRKSPNQVLYFNFVQSWIRQFPTKLHTYLYYKHAHGRTDGGSSYTSQPTESSISAGWTFMGNQSIM